LGVESVTDSSSTAKQGLIGWAGGPRAIVAVVFTDIRNSTALADDLGDESMDKILDAHFGQSERLIAEHDGYRIKGLGDGDLAGFRSVDAVLDYTLALHAHSGDAQIEVRAGIHVGSVRVLADDIRGGAVNFAARVGGATKAPEIWISDIAFDHLIAEKANRHQNLRWEDHPDVDLKGLGVHRLWSLAPAGSGRTMAEIVAQRARPRALAVAESNIPEGMVPRHFVGREDALAEIAAALEGLGGRAAITALHGLRGVGKTVLAAAYAERHRADYRATWWIRAETEPGLRADLVGLAVRLQWVAADEKEEPALAAVRERLRQEGDGILLIFDSARDAEALRPWLPRGGASRIIVTSNAPNWGAVATPVAIRVWPKETGADFLIARTGRQGERTAAEALSEALAGLPLAHEMAASYCDRTGTSFAAYRGKFDAAPVHLLDIDKDAPTEYHDRLTVAKTFALAIEEAAKQHPAAETLIVHAALLAPEPIPLFLFTEGREEFGEELASLLADDGLDEAVAALRAFALIDREAIPDERDPAITTDSVRLHRLVREVAAGRREGSALGAARRALIEAMASVYPQDVDRGRPAAWPRARRLDAPAMALVSGDASLPQGAEIAASLLMDGLGRYRTGVLAAYAPARPLFEQALAIREKALGPDHPDTAMSLHNLAFLVRDQGDLATARPLYERALAIREKALGPEHPDTATTLDNVASLLQDQGDPAAARPLCERALAIREKALGPDDSYTATSLNNLASLLQDQGDPAAARPRYQRALAIREKTLGPDHPETATSLGNLAGLLRAQGDLAAARPLYERALAIHERVLGPDHPVTATSLNNLAGLFQTQGDFAAARPRYERALAIREKALGPEHPDTAASLNNLAGLFQAQGDLAAARPLFERALAIREKALGPDHPDTANSLNNLAGLFQAQGDLAAARPLCERALAINEKVLGPDHPATRIMRNNLAALSGLNRHERRAAASRRKTSRR
jgi:class 3 adenylate cyclase/tetratricopeptide (TPR) repeat protein